MIDTLLSWLAFLTEQITYTTIFVMMALEASLVPFPSEVAMIPAGYRASLGELDFMLAFAAGMAGVFVGSTFNYLLGRYVGRECILRFGKYFLISRESYEKSERLFAKNAILYTFVGRLIPAVRQLISIPAGMARMRYDLFLATTMAGAGIWLLILMWLGYAFGENQERIEQYLHIIV